MSTAKFHQDEIHSAKVKKTKDQFIVILAFKIDTPNILGVLGEEKYLESPYCGNLNT